MLSNTAWLCIMSMFMHVRCFKLDGLRLGRTKWLGVSRLSHSIHSFPNEESTLTKNFITNIIDADLSHGVNGGRVVTRFPPEPNGYLHLGHAKSINFNFAVAKAYNGVTHMRFDDTNPAKEDMEYVKSILQDVQWLVTGELTPSTVPWHGPVRHASDYFQTLYDSAEYLIKQGLAYVDDLSPEEMKEYRGTLTEPGKNSPYRDRSVDENLRLFRSMRAGHFADGQCVLRAKIDMTSSNTNMRDPTIYRIKKEAHPITGSAWCIYPMYDFAHALSDALEGITHSLCTLEFENHRPLYDWCVEHVMPSGLLPFKEEGWRPHQYEFSRLNMQYTVLSKRKLIELVSQGHVDGWDDPRLPTIAALRRRGFPASAVRLFSDRVGISKVDNNIDISVLEDCAREVLDAEAPRLFALAKPLKVTITNWERDSTDPEMVCIDNHPKLPELGKRAMPFTGSVFIEREDFFDTRADIVGQTPLEPPKGYKRLLPGGQVRLKNAFVVTCNKVLRDPVSGDAVELECAYDARTRHGNTPAGAAKVKGIVQWVSQSTAVPVDLYLYDRLFLTPSPGKEQPDGDFLKDLNPQSLEIVAGAVVEPSVLSARNNATFQFERIGYFSLDCASAASAPAAGGKSTVDGSRKALRFNRVVTLKDTWKNQLAAGAGGDATAAAATATTATLPAFSASHTGNNNNNNNSNDLASPVKEDVRRLEMRVGRILSAARHPDADTLYVLQVQVQEDDKVGGCTAEAVSMVGVGSDIPAQGHLAGVRTIISGLAGRIPLESLAGRKVVVLCNLKPSKMRGIVSEGMLLAASATRNNETEEVVELLTPPEGAPIGELIHVQGFAAPQPDAVLKSKAAQDVWKRVATVLSTNANCEATYGENKHVLTTSSGPCVVQTLKDAAIR